jgi:hypothetical protein
MKTSFTSDIFSAKYGSHHIYAYIEPVPKFGNWQIGAVYQLILHSFKRCYSNAVKLARIVE